MIIVTARISERTRKTGDFFTEVTVIIRFLLMSGITIEETVAMPSTA